MMKKTLLAVMTAAALASGVAQAIDYPAGTINFSGSIVPTTCAFTINGVAGTVDVDLGKIAISDFNGINSKSPSTPLTIAATGCPTSATAVTLTLGQSNDADNINSDYFANTGTNPATGVAIEVLTAADAAVVPGTSTDPVTVNNGAFSIPLTAQIVQTTITAPMEGAVSATVAVSVVY